MKPALKSGSRTWWGVAGIVALIAAFSSVSLGAKTKHTLPGISPTKVADYVHAVIEADRTIYTTHVVARMQEKGIVVADEHWEQRNALPLPAQFLKYAGRMAAEGGSGIRYELMSLWPIRNGPATEFERKGLEAVLAKPEQAHTGIVKSGRKRYFQAVYADRAISKACVTCHNGHVLSPKRDFKLNDVMGATVITIPLER